MSLVNFDDFCDICLGMMEPEKGLEKRLVLKPRPKIERFEIKKLNPTNAIPWWEEAVREIERERREEEREVFYV